MELLLIKDFVFLILIGAAAYFSHKKGVLRGIDESIKILANAGLIDVEDLEDGEQIYTRPENK